MGSRESFHEIILISFNLDGCNVFSSSLLPHKNLLNIKMERKNILISIGKVVKHGNVEDFLVHHQIKETLVKPQGLQIALSVSQTGSFHCWVSIII